MLPPCYNNLMLTLLALALELGGEKFQGIDDRSFGKGIHQLINPHERIAAQRAGAACPLEPLCSPRYSSTESG